MNATVDFSYDDDGGTFIINKPAPCPFEHYDDEPLSPIITNGFRSVIVYVECPTCLSRGPVAESAAMAVRNWNVRVRVK